MDFYSLYETFSIYGIGVHIAIAVLFAIHAVKNKHNMYWIWLLFVFPILGSIVYFFAVYLPSTQADRHAKKLSELLLNFIQPGRNLKKARKAFQLAPSLNNRIRVAKELLNIGQKKEALSEYNRCLEQSPDDLNLKLDISHARFANQEYESALQLLREIRTADASFMTEDVTLLSAKTLAACHRGVDARAQFEYLLNNYSNFEGKAEYAIWLHENYEREYAQKLKSDIDLSIMHWTKYAKNAHKSILLRLKKTFPK